MANRISWRNNIDWITFSLYLSLVAIGWMMIYAVSYSEGADNSIFSLRSHVGKQLIWIGVSLVILFFTFIIDSKFWQTFAYVIYGVANLLLIGVLIFGVEVNGAKSWYSIGGFTLQPSEFAKFATCLAISAYLSTYSTKINNLKSLSTAVGIFILPVILILLQSDAGSALVFLSFSILLFRQGLSSDLYLFGISAITLSILGLAFDPRFVSIGLMLFLSAVLIFNLKNKFYWLLSLGGLVALSIVGITQSWVYPILGINLLYLSGFAIYLWRNRRASLVKKLGVVFLLGGILTFSSNYAFNNVLESHQQERINVWLKPSTCDPQGSLYNVLQSKMAIGSGGFQGKGFLQGTMTKLNYVPEQLTDFIFCTVGEEQGFIGSFGIITLFLLLILRITTIAERQRNDFARNYAYGVAGILFIHFFVNIGMTMGLVPIIGIPLPFISKGGSSLLGFTLMIGILLKFDWDRMAR